MEYQTTRKRPWRTEYSRRYSIVFYKPIVFEVVAFATRLRTQHSTTDLISWAFFHFRALNNIIARQVGLSVCVFFHQGEGGIMKREIIISLSLSLFSSRRKKTTKQTGGEWVDTETIMRRSHELQNTTTGPHITPASKKKNKKTKTNK